MRFAAAQYIQDRRFADPLWVRRYKRSLGRNKRFRACIRMGHKLRKEMENTFKAAEHKQSESAVSIFNRLSDWCRRTFTRRASSAY